VKYGQLLLRGTVGALFIGHGTQKLFGSFGGYGLDATGEAFESMGIRPGRAQATLAGAAEAGGGLGLLLGFQTPLAAAALIATMTTAIERVHFKNGPWVTKGGYEYNLVLIAAAAALAEAGPGEFSVDHLLGSKQQGLRWGLTAVGLGVGGAAAAHVITETLFPAPEQAEVDATPAPRPESKSVPAAPAAAVSSPAPHASAPVKPTGAAAKPAAKPKAAAKPAAKPKAAAKPAAKPKTTTSKPPARKSGTKAPIDATIDAADLIADR
jgi:putative oxidoreductase